MLDVAACDLNHRSIGYEGIRNREEEVFAAVTTTTAGSMDTATARLVCFHSFRVVAPV